MNRSLRRLLAAGVALLGTLGARSSAGQGAAPGGAQSGTPGARLEAAALPPAPPKTKLEAFQTRSGVAIVRGASEAGTLLGLYSTSVVVESHELSDAASGRRERGVAVRVRERGSRANVSYVDYDEIEPLLRGLDYLAKATSKVTPFANFQVDYRTRGDLLVSAFSADRGTKATVQSGAAVVTTAYLEQPDLAKLRDLVAAAKATLDSLRK